MSSQDKTLSDVPVLAESFDLSAHLRLAEARSAEIRFFGKVLGQREDTVLCETAEGVYQFKRDDVVSLEPVHARLDQLLIKREAEFTLHSTVARLARSKQMRPRVPGEAGGTNDAARQDDTDGGGGHEWRGFA